MFFGFFRVLHEHIQRLSKVVTANHRALQIPEVTQVYVTCVLLLDKNCLVHYVPISKFSRKRNMISDKTPFALDAG